MKDNLLSNTQNGGSRLNKNAASLDCNISEKQHAFDVDRFADVHGVNTQSPLNSGNKTNNTGLPDNLRAGVESLSGYAMDDVKVHYNSCKPTQLQAHAYAQGSDIHLAPGQEKYLPHEAWHVVQQKQGKVKPTFQVPAPNVHGIQASDSPVQMAVTIKGKGTYDKLNSLLGDLRTYKRKNDLGQNITKNLRELVTADFDLMDDLPFDSIEDYHNDLVTRLGGGTKGKKNTPKYGEPGYVFKPQTSGKMFDCMEGVKTVNSKEENKINWGHVGIEREEIKQNVCGANNMGYIKSFYDTDVDTIEREKLHGLMTNGQMTGSYIAMDLLDSSGLKNDMTELQMVFGVDKKENELLMMGGNTNKGNKAFRKYIGKNTLSDMYKSKYSEEHRIKYMGGLETAYNESEEFKREVDQEKPNKKRLRELSNITDPGFRKKRKFRNAMKQKPTPDSKSTYGDMELVIPDNPKDKHTETNILHYAIEKSIKVEQAVGTKVPCLSCFAAFCKEKNSDALLPGFGYLWFSESSVQQHVIDGIKDGTFTAKEAAIFLEFIEKCLAEYMKQNNPFMYTGSMGDIKPEYHDDDSGSEGEEFRDEFVKSKRSTK